MVTKTKKSSKKSVRSIRAKALVMEEAGSLSNKREVIDSLRARRIVLGTGKPRKKTGRSHTVARQTAELQKKSESGSAQYRANRQSRATVRDPKERFVTVTESAVEKSGGLKGSGLIEVGRSKKLELRHSLGMTRPIFGRIVNVAERTIAKVESGAETPDKLKRPYNEVYRLWEALSELVESSAIGAWFQEPNDAFGGLKPIEVIERGEIDRLWDMVFELQTGMPR